MATVDMRPTDTSDEVPDEEVKTTEAEEAKVDGEGAEGVSSTPEQTQEAQEGGDKVEDPTSVEAPDATEDEAEEVSKDDVDALRMEREKLLSDIRNLRSDRRELKTKKDDVEAPVFVDAPKEDDLKDVNPDDVALVEKVLKSKGYVRREELQEQTYKSEVNKHTESWLEDHPEYKPENDPKDEKWDALRTTIKTYFKAPSSPKEISKVLDLAHQMLNPDVKLPVRSKAEVDAAQRKISMSSKGASGSSGSTDRKSKGSIPNKDYLKGFSDEEIGELFS